MLNDINIKSSPKFSIITVCFNALSVLPTTVSSLRCQTNNDYEWVVVDGASTDGTAEWLNLQKPSVFLSEPDEGIYDAMNKAVRHAQGEWLFFLNAGDSFADPDVLQDIAIALDVNAGNFSHPAIIFGDVIYFGDKGQRRKRFNWLSRNRLIFGDLCHQATFVKRKLFLKHGGFDTTLRFNADFDWLIRTFKAKENIQYLPRDIALFNDAGSHVQNHLASEAERNRVRQKYCSRPLWLIGHWALRIELKMRHLIEAS